MYNETVIIDFSSEAMEVKVMKSENQLLIASAAKLVSLGKEVEAARAKLRRLVEQGVPYDSPEMLTVYHSFMEKDSLWKEVERQHIALRAEITKKL